MVKEIKVHPYLIQDLEKTLQDLVSTFSTRFSFPINVFNNEYDTDPRRLDVLNNLNRINKIIKETRSISKNDMIFIKKCSKASIIDYSDRVYYFLTIKNSNDNPFIPYLSTFLPFTLILPTILPFLFSSLKYACNFFLIYMVIVLLSFLIILFGSMCLDWTIPKKFRINRMYTYLKTLIPDINNSNNMRN